MPKLTQSGTSSPSFEEGEPKGREANLESELIKETLLTQDSPSTSDSDDDKSDSLHQKEADMAVYNEHPSRSQSSHRPQPLTIRIVQSHHDIAVESDELQQAQQLVPQQPPQPAEPVEQKRKPTGFKKFLFCCFRPDLSEDEDEDQDEEEEPKDYKMETFASYPRQQPAMGRFGSLFRKSDDKKSDQAGENPYAQQSPADTYSSQRPSGSSFQSNSSHNNNQYHQNQSGLPSGPRPGGYGRSDLNSAPPPYQSSSASTPSNQKSPAVGYTNDRFGAQSGYGKNRFDNDAQSFQNNAPSQRTGGYGGLGGDNQLFNDYVPPSNRPNAAAGPQQQQLDGFRDEYGNLREMTEEEKEEAEVQLKKNEITGVLHDTAASSARSRQMMDEGVQRLIAMHQMLDVDTERLNRAEDRLDETLHQNKVATENLKSLDAANTSMFNFVANSKGRIADGNARRHQADRERELAKQELRHNEQQANREWEAAMKQRTQAKPTILGAGGNKNNSKFVFEEDAEQEELNQAIDQDVEAMTHTAGTLHMLADGFGRRIDQQNQQISRMNDKATNSGDILVKNRGHMKTKYGS